MERMPRDCGMWLPYANQKRREVGHITCNVGGVPGVGVGVVNGGGSDEGGASVNNGSQCIKI